MSLALALAVSALAPGAARSQAKLEGEVAPRSSQTPALALFVFTGPSGAAPFALRGLEQSARTHGSVVRDLRPAPVPLPSAPQELARGLAAFRDFDYGRALGHLQSATEEAEASGADGLSHDELGDLYMYRALVFRAQGDESKAWENFVQAAVIAPDRHLDVARFAPSAVAAFERARTSVTSGASSSLTIALADTCALWVDGREHPLSEPLQLRHGIHFFRSACADGGKRGLRIAVEREMELDLQPKAAPTPERDALLQMAKRGGFSHLLWAKVSIDAQGRSNVKYALYDDTGATIGQSAIDLGAPTETQGRSEAACSRLLDALQPNAGADVLVTPRTADEPWYKNRWLWAGVGAAAATAVLLPFVLREPVDGFDVRLQGETP